jgi:hypothetical protein
MAGSYASALPQSLASIPGIYPCLPQMALNQVGFTG